MAETGPNGTRTGVPDKELTRWEPGSDVELSSTSVSGKGTEKTESMETGLDGDCVHHWKNGMYHAFKACSEDSSTGRRVSPLCWVGGCVVVQSLALPVVRTLVPRQAVKST